MTRRLLSLFMLIRRMKPFVDPALRPIEPPIHDDPSEPYLQSSAKRIGTAHIMALISRI